MSIIPKFLVTKEIWSIVDQEITIAIGDKILTHVANPVYWD